MEGITPYALWNKFRSQFSDISREPAKVIMKDFHLIYPELMDSMSFPEFSQDYLEVSDQYPVSKSPPALSSLKEQCHEDFAVLGQFCTKITTLRL